MNANIWRTLHKKKERLSLRLFLFLNPLTALFTLAPPDAVTLPSSAPAIAIIAASALLLRWHDKYGHRKITSPLIAAAVGLLWAGHILLQHPLAQGEGLPFAPLSVLFIGAIAFTNNLVAFILYSLPAAAACLWLKESQYGPSILWPLALTTAGIAARHLFQQREDALAQRLLYQLLKEKEALTDLSMLDPLTGLYNRRGLQNQLEALPPAADGERYVLLLDLDHFKAYNDHYGHMMGDQALIRVSAAIQDTVRSRDVVARFGGEEFIVLLATASAQQARASAERIRRRICELEIPHRFNERVATTVTVSIGIAPLIRQDVAEAIARADRALYQAKHLGRNHTLFSEDPRTDQEPAAQ